MHKIQAGLKALIAINIQTLLLFSHLQVKQDLSSDFAWGVEWGGSEELG